VGKTKPKFKMPISERAKQFAPFSPLNGLEEALAEREKHKEGRRYPDEDALIEINTVLSEIKKDDTASVFFYNTAEMRYEQVEGEIHIIDELHKRIFLCGREIRFDDILGIEITKRRNGN